MANTLTWRDVAAPDFSTGLRGIAIAGNNASQGFDALGQALGNFQTYRQGEAANQVLNNAAGYSDPAELRAAIANGSLFGGIDRSLVTPQTLAALNNQPGVLLNQGTEQERLSHMKAIDPLLVQNQQGQNQHQDITNQYDIAANPKRLVGLDLANDQTAATTRGTNANTADTLQRTSQSGTVFGQSQDAYKAQQEAIPFLNQLKTQINGPDDVQNVIASPEFQKLSPMARQNVLAGIAGGPAAAGPASRAIAGATGAPGAVPGSASASPFSAIPGYMAKPGDPDISTMKIGDVQKYQTDTVLPRTGATSIGAFQINRDTITQYAPKALGADWKDQTLDATAQDKIAHAIFDDKKNGNLHATWTALPDTKEGAYAGKSWEEMRSLISGGETRDVGPVNKELFNLNQENNSYGARAGSAVKAINLAASQQTANNLSGKYADTQKVSDTTGAVVAKMTGKDSTSSYKDLPISRLTQEIEDIKQRIPGATSATAAAILEEHPQGAGWFARHLPGVLGGYTNIPNTDATEKEAAAVNTGSTYEADRALAGAQALSASITQAQTAHQTAITDLAQALHNPSLSADQVNGYRVKANITRAILDDRLKTQKNDETLNYHVNTPSPGESKAVTLPAAQTDTGSVPNPFEPPAQTSVPAAANAPASQAINTAASPFVGGANGPTVQAFQPPPPLTKKELADYRARRKAALSAILDR